MAIALLVRFGFLNLLEWVLDVELRPQMSQNHEILPVLEILSCQKSEIVLIQVLGHLLTLIVKQ